MLPAIAPTPLGAKHITLRYSFIQELVEDGTITIQYAKTQDQLADSWTQHLNKQRHRELINKNQGLRSLNGIEDLVLVLGVFAGTRFCCVRRSTRQEH